MPLSAVSRVSDVNRMFDPVLPGFPDDTKFFVFADYLQWSWAYSIRLAGAMSGRIVIVGKPVPEIVADSFDEFVRLYVADAEPLIHDAR